MLKHWIGRRIAAFEREFDYDMSYAREILAAGVGPFRKFNAVGAMARERGPVPVAPWFGAKIAAALHENAAPVHNSSSGWPSVPASSQASSAR